MRLVWNELTPSDFEKVCYFLLEQNGFRNLSWHGSTGSDRGRDILAEKTIEPLPGVTKQEKWLIQCKRYIDKRISKTELSRLVADAQEHHPDCVLLIITDTLNSALKDWIRSVGQKCSFSLHVWEELNLRKELWRHSRHISALLPELSRQKNPIDFYPVNHASHCFICNEFDEIEIRSFNKRDRKEAAAEVEEFLRFVRENDFTITPKA
jgi:hypothetical protein